MYIHYSDVTIENAILFNNTATGNGGAMDIYTFSRVIIRQSTLIGNIATNEIGLTGPMIITLINAITNNTQVGNHITWKTCEIVFVLDNVVQ